MALILVSEPQSEPLTTDEAKADLRVQSTSEDTLIADLIKAAREQAENHTHRKLITQTWDYVLDYFPSVIRLPFAPVQSIVSITYLDDSGVEQTLDSALYRADVKSEPGRITPAYGQAWPSTYPVTGAVTVRAVYGYESASVVPSGIKKAMRLLINQWFDNRGAVNIGNIVNELPNGVEALLFSHVVWSH